MSGDCQLVVFSDKAYNAIIRETFEWEPVETGGILLGHVLDNGCWIVMEVLPPGYGEGREGDNVYHEYGYFEYNRKFVNYLAKSVAEQYDIPLELLGLWHRHPGGMDHFSGTDDGTNSTFAAQSQHGVISGLINVDPQLRMTMYYLAHNDARGYGRPNYKRVEVEVGSDLIPQEYFKLRYYQGGERDLHPYAPQKVERHGRKLQQTKNTEFQNPEASDESVVSEHINGTTIIKEQMTRNSRGNVNQNNSIRKQEETALSVAEDIIEKIKKNKIAIILILAIIAFLFSLSSIKNDFSKVLQFFEGERNNNEVVIVAEETERDAKGDATEITVTSKDDNTVIEQKDNPDIKDPSSPDSNKSEGEKYTKATVNSKKGK